MNRRILAGIGLTVLLGGGVVLMTARAQQDAKKSSAPAGKITPWAAMSIATRKVPGRALNANFEFAEGHWVYAVIVVNGKTLKEVEIDPITGKVGDTETITPEDEAKEVASELKAALNGGKAQKESGDKEGNKEKDEKDEKDEKGENR